MYLRRGEPRLLNYHFLEYNMCLNIFDNVIRRRYVLDFFHKPDIASYGGDYNERINTYGGNGLTQVYGTSFASAWIARKLCFLIDVMKFPIEIAKALIIDSAAGW